jgi:hypothetical protein
MSPFNRNKLLKSVQDVKQLATRLSKRPEVSRFDGGQHNESWALAHTFADIEGEFREFLDEQLPKLMQVEGEELSAVLVEIGVSFQHILYHVTENQKFYRYLIPEGPRSLGLSPAPQNDP